MNSIRYYAFYTFSWTVKKKGDRRNNATLSASRQVYDGAHFIGFPKHSCPINKWVEGKKAVESICQEPGDLWARTFRFLEDGRVLFYLLTCQVDLVGLYVALHCDTIQYQGDYKNGYNVFFCSY